jgi:hypothetical protein
VEWGLDEGGGSYSACLGDKHGDMRGDGRRGLGARVGGEVGKGSSGDESAGFTHFEGSQRERNSIAS